VSTQFKVGQSLVKSQQGKKPPQKLWVVFLLVTLAIASGGFGATLAFVMASKPFQQKTLSPEELAVFGNSDMAAPTLGLPDLTRSVNILILGTIVLSTDLPGSVDPPKGEYMPQVSSSLDGQSDAMLLVRFDPITTKVTVLSIPRDSQVQIPNLGVRKINAANYVGGAALSAQVVSKLTGDIRIDRYIRVNVGGFGQLIDALGGVNVYVPKRMKYQDDSQHLYINLNQGQQHLDGNKAIQYMRYRHDELGDIGRVQRQQAFFRDLIDQKFNLANITRTPQIMSVLKQNIDTNLSVQEMMALGAFAAKAGRKDTKLLLAPGRFSTVDEFPVSYWLINDRQLMRLMAQHFNVINVQSQDKSQVVDHNSPDSLRIAIQDSTYHPEAVVMASKVLTNQGYAQVFSEPKWSRILDKTQIIAQQGDRLSAEEIRDRLGIGEVIVESTGILESDVTVRLGKDWLPLMYRKLASSKPKK
jgi:polyisoprenyl-teichoic acid--peptidoglycan teichoic acid transferase